MVRIVKPGRAVYLLFHRNEGQWNNYSWPHTWDIDVGGPLGTSRDALLRGKSGLVIPSLRRHFDGRAPVAVRVFGALRQKEGQIGPRVRHWVEIVMRRMS